MYYVYVSVGVWVWFFFFFFFYYCLNVYWGENSHFEEK